MGDWMHLTLGCHAPASHSAQLCWVTAVHRAYLLAADTPLCHQWGAAPSLLTVSIFNDLFGCNALLINCFTGMRCPNWPDTIGWRQTEGNVCFFPGETLSLGTTTLQQCLRLWGRLPHTSWLLQVCKGRFSLFRPFGDPIHLFHLLGTQHCLYQLLVCWIYSILWDTYHLWRGHSQADVYWSLSKIITHTHKKKIPPLLNRSFT